MCGQHDDRHTTVIAVLVKYFTLLLIVTPSICSQISKLHFEYCWSFDMFDWDTFLIHQHFCMALRYMWVKLKM